MEAATSAAKLSNSDVVTKGSKKFWQYRQKNPNTNIVINKAKIPYCFKSIIYLKYFRFEYDDNLEIIFYGYTSSGNVYAINHDGSNVANFPVNINEKVLKGGAIYDLNNNGLDDIVVINTDDATLVIPREKVEDVKDLVESLKANGQEKLI